MKVWKWYTSGWSMLRHQIPTRRIPPRKTQVQKERDLLLVKCRHLTWDLSKVKVTVTWNTSENHHTSRALEQKTSWDTLGYRPFFQKKIGDSVQILLNPCVRQSKREFPNFRKITSWWLNHPFEKYSSNWIISPGIGVKIKNIWNHHPNHIQHNFGTHINQLQDPITIESQIHGKYGSKNDTQLHLTRNEDFLDK